MSGGLNWEHEGRDWPHRDSSSFVEAGRLHWHVQTMGEGPVALLLHGTGASTHSWRGMAPILAKRFTVVAPDLPGHGFTGAPLPSRLSLPHMAKSIRSLLETLEIAPDLAIGHSAGAAILARMCVDTLVAPKLLISLNGALLPFGGHARYVFPALAKILFLNPFAPRLFTWRASDASAVERVISGTGSELGPEGVALYARLFQSRQHVAGALGMMANWDLVPLERDLSRLPCPLLHVVGEKDKAVPPADAGRIADLVPDAELERIPERGHLAHEEDPGRIAALIVNHAASRAVLHSEQGSGGDKNDVA